MACHLMSAVAEVLGQLVSAAPISSKLITNTNNIITTMNSILKSQESAILMKSSAN